MVCMVWYGRLWFVSVYGWVIVCTHVCVLCVCGSLCVCVCALASGHASPTPSKPKACWTAGNNCAHVAPFARKTVPYLIACLLTYLLTYLYTYLLACLLVCWLPAIFRGHIFWVKLWVYFVSEVTTLHAKLEPTSSATAKLWFESQIWRYSCWGDSRTRKWMNSRYYNMRVSFTSVHVSLASRWNPCHRDTAHQFWGVFVYRLDHFCKFLPWAPGLILDIRWFWLFFVVFV